MRILAPSIDAALSKKALVQSLPVPAICLNTGSIWYAEFGSCGMTPVARFEADIGVIEGLTCCAEGEEALGIEVGKDEDEDVERKVREGSHILCRRDMYYFEQKLYIPIRN